MKAMNRTICLFSLAMLLSQLGILVVHHRHLETIIGNENNKENQQQNALIGNQNRNKNRRQTYHNTTNTSLGLSADRYQHSKRRLLVHLHIGKTGCSSLELITPRLARQTNRTLVPPAHVHFDWSYIDKLPQDKMDVITLLRHPVSRAISQFYYAKTLKWTRNKPIGRMKLGEYLQSKEELLKTRTIWVDGQAATWWLTGTHVETWVHVDPSQVTEREQIYAENATAMLHLAADRLDETLWFGILEDLPRSMELLQHALGLDYTPTLPTANKNAHPSPTESEKNALASLMPRDLWVYQYGKRLFEARYTAMKTGEAFVKPERPSIPETWSCISTRTKLECNTGPFQGTYEKESPHERLKVEQQ